MLSAGRRFIMLPIAFLLATAATLFVIISLGHERVVQAMTGARRRRVCQSTRVPPVRARRAPFGADAAAGAAAGDHRRGGAHPERLYYVVGGGVALAMCRCWRASASRRLLDLSPVVWQVLATAGFAGRLRLLAAGRTECLRLAPGNEKFD